MQQQFKIKGMTCSGCAAKIATSLSKQSDVEEVVIDFATNSGRIKGPVSFEDVSSHIKNLGYAAVQDFEDNDLRDSQKTLVSLPLMFAAILALVVMLLAMGPWQIPYNPWIQLVLSAVFILIPARGFIHRALVQAKNLDMTMDTLVSLGMLSSWAGSCLMLLQGGHHFYFESAVMIGFFVLLGKYIEEGARESSIHDVNQLLSLKSKKSWVISTLTNQPTEVDTSAVGVGDIVYLRPGDRLSFDGVVNDSSGTLDESVVSGESLPVIKLAGEEVQSGSINVGTTGIRVLVKKIGKDTYVEKIIGIIQEAKYSRPSVQLLADKISGFFVPVIVFLAVVTGIFWKLFMKESLEASTINALTVLVVACPCALGLATPVAWIAGIGRAAKFGILVKNYDALEALSKIDTVVFDKTGTLTEGQPVIANEYWNPQIDKKGLALKIVSGLVHSSHPLSKAVSKHLRKNLALDDLPRSLLANDVPGQGFEVSFNSATDMKILKFGKPSYVLDESLFLEDWKNSLHHEGSILAVSDGFTPMVLFTLEDRLREDANEEISKLKNQKIKVVIASGDKQKTVSRVVEKLKDVHESYGDLSPVDKLELIRSLKLKGHVVAFVGDGINDGPAIAAADAGLAMASGADVASMAAGLVIQREGMRSIGHAIELSRKTTLIIKQNIFWAFFYNVVSIPLAMAGYMTPMIAAGVMVFSSLSVVLNAMRLKRV